MAYQNPYNQAFLNNLPNTQPKVSPMVQQNSTSPAITNPSGKKTYNPQSQALPINIKKFYETLQSTEMLFSYQYSVTINFNELLTKRNTDDNLLFTFLAQSMSLPGRSLTEVDLEYQGFKYTLPNRVSYNNEISLDVMCDSGMRLWTMFDEWMSKHCSYEADGGGDKTIAPNSIIRLDLFNHSLDGIIATYELKDCWPKRVGEIGFGQDLTRPATFTVSMAYQYFQKSTNGG